MEKTSDYKLRGVPLQKATPGSSAPIAAAPRFRLLVRQTAS
jgi:hypothetical protein